jgi:hypothetical protein
MSVPPRRHLPERPSLEQLRKQAREHLDALRAADPSVNLAAAQHALAREYGFESWPKLVHHVESMQPANRMLQPAELKSDQKLLWSQGRGTDVWALMQACASGDLTAVRALIAQDPSLARSHYDYRKPLYFAVRENRIDVVRFLLEHDCNPLDLWMDDDPIEIARDRGYTEMEQLLTHTLDTNFNASPQGEPVALALREHDLKQMRELLDAQPALVGKGEQKKHEFLYWEFHEGGFSQSVRLGKWKGVRHAIDGPLARKLDVVRLQPNWSGEVLDLVVDFVTYVFVPAYAITASARSIACSRSRRSTSSSCSA